MPVLLLLHHASSMHVDWNWAEAGCAAKDVLNLTRRSTVPHSNPRSRRRKPSLGNGMYALDESTRILDYQGSNPGSATARRLQCKYSPCLQSGGRSFQEVVACMLPASNMLRSLVCSTHGRCMCGAARPGGTLDCSCSIDLQLHWSRLRGINPTWLDRQYIRRASHAMRRRVHVM